MEIKVSFEPLRKIVIELNFLNLIFEVREILIQNRVSMIRIVRYEITEGNKGRT